ncbi:unnamed protein product [Miscanthus lutarioriparius]|uniref:Uncharacterized protein n=1 Tax=Miscanthus lutarioriparius TaxID=422564 RepID=A0A811QUS0_9POAL|nr:unnamed protein product [Miscanthus lutarioriparius]
MGFPAVAARAHVVLALHAILLLGCAAVLLSPAHGTVANLARRATALGAPARAPVGLLRWLGFAGIVLYTLYVTGDVAARKEAAAEAEWPDTVKGFLLFLMFLVGVWAVYLSLMRERGGPPRPLATAAAEPEASLDRVEVWAVYLPMVAMDTGKGGPPPRLPAAAAEEDHDSGEVNAITPKPACVVVVDTKVWNMHSSLLILESLKISRLTKRISVFPQL